MSVDILAQIIVEGWTCCQIALHVISCISVPVLIVFLFHRRAQFYDPQFDDRVTLPTHTLLHYFCAIVYGLFLPACYFISDPGRGAADPLPLHVGLGKWALVLGVICMCWLAAHLLEALLRRGRPCFGPHRLDRVVSGAAFALCLYLHVRTIGPCAKSVVLKIVSSDDVFIVQLLFATLRLIYLQAGMLGATLVYGLAFREALTARPAPELRRRWRAPIAATAALLIMLCLPFLLSLPRVTHRQALTLLEKHRPHIQAASKDAQIDPAILAGVIYVAQTRDHPRWTGDFVESLSLAIWNQCTNHQYRYGYPPEQKLPHVNFGRHYRLATRFNASAGLCQIRPGTIPQFYRLLSAKVQDLRRKKPQGLMTIQSYTSRELYKKHLAETKAWEKSMDRNLGLIKMQPAADNLRDRLLPTDANLRLSASMLSWLELEWAAAGFPLNDRPEILATLYNRGFGASKPHAKPQPNDFGRRALKFMQSEDCRRLFPPAEKAAADER